jgi:protocatechuate 3,4-dioxygenase beta subunit
VSSRRDPKVFAPYLHEAYRSTIRRAPTKAPMPLPQTISEMTGPALVAASKLDNDVDLTRNAGGGEAIGERIIVTGRVLDDDGEPVVGTLVEVWQANAAGRYRHKQDTHGAPIDPNFLGIGACRTDQNGVYRFVTVRPGAYPWGNHDNAWRPAHIHFSLFGPSVTGRLVTQMYFPGDPLLDLDPIFNSVPTDAARERLVSRYSHDVTQEGWALGYDFDIVVRGPARRRSSRRKGIEWPPAS